MINVWNSAERRLTSGKLEDRGLDGGGLPAGHQAGSLLHLLHRGRQLIKLAVAALQGCLARHLLGHMLPEVALAGLHCQEGPLQSCPLFCCPACNWAAGPATGGGLLGAALPVKLWGCTGRP